MNNNSLIMYWLFALAAQVHFKRSTFPCSNYLRHISCTVSAYSCDLLFGPTSSTQSNRYAPCKLMYLLELPSLTSAWHSLTLPVTLPLRQKQNFSYDFFRRCHRKNIAWSTNLSLYLLPISVGELNSEHRLYNLVKLLSLITTTTTTATTTKEKETICEDFFLL